MLRPSRLGYHVDLRLRKPSTGRDRYASHAVPPLQVLCTFLQPPSVSETIKTMCATRLQISLFIVKNVRAYVAN